MPEGLTREPRQHVLGKIFNAWERFQGSRPWLAGLIVRVLFFVFLEQGFDFVLYSTAQVGVSYLADDALVGAVIGTLIMAVLAGLINWWMLSWYDNRKRDVFGLEAEKELVAKVTGINLPEKVRTKPFWTLWALLVLPAATDPYFAVVRIRPKNCYEMDTGFWMFFMTSIVIGNLVWGVFIWGVIAFFTFATSFGTDVLFLSFLLVMLIVNIIWCPIPARKVREE